MSSRSLLPDICQCVFEPGNPAMLTTPPCFPVSVQPDAHGSIKARYMCPDCGRRWNVWWNREYTGWSLGDVENYGQDSGSAA